MLKGLVFQYTFEKDFKMNIKKPDKTNLREQFEAEKERLAIEFTLPKRAWWQSSIKIKYETTWDIANTPPYIQKDIDCLVVINEKHSWILVLGFIVFFILTFFTNSSFKEGNINLFSILFLISLLISLGITIVHNADRSPKIVIDKSGIYIGKNCLQLEWHKIVNTYIKIDEAGEDTSYSLYIRYIDDDYWVFKTEEIPISGFIQGYAEIAYAIEYIKKNAPDFQGHFS